MKVFSKTTAALAVVLTLFSMLMLLVCGFLKDDILSLTTGRIFQTGFWVGIPLPYFLICILEIVFIAPMILLGGRKHGGIWVEIAALVLILTVIPLVSLIADYIWDHTQDIFLRYYNYVYVYGSEAAEYYRVQLQEHIFEYIWEQIKYSLTWEYIRYYIYDRIFPYNESFAHIHDLFSWCMGGARLGMILGFVSIGTSMAGVAKQRKDKRKANKLAKELLAMREAAEE